ncbi:uncharacterized protein LOC122264244 [Penaeus japonicus]|uniref:uncharacterized protein LOC122264244 n=1 Tax=Penaeus japonicus TaxID=27405 RepID=UPI001C70C3CF|nr:uncharacterized protein LOC122264244 [Penaeus japonicus]
MAFTELEVAIIFLIHDVGSSPGDTTVIVGVGCGSLLGSWLNYQLGITREPTLPPPYTVIWPTLNMAGLSLLRTILGLVVIVAVKAIFKALSFATICALLQLRHSIRLMSKYTTTEFEDALDYFKSEGLSVKYNFGLDFPNGIKI